MLTLPLTNWRFSLYYKLWTNQKLQKIVFAISAIFGGGGGEGKGYFAAVGTFTIHVMFSILVSAQVGSVEVLDSGLMVWIYALIKDYYITGRANPIFCAVALP